MLVNINVLKGCNLAVKDEEKIASNAVKSKKRLCKCFIRLTLHCFLFRLIIALLNKKGCIVANVAKGTGEKIYYESESPV